MQAATEMTQEDAQGSSPKNANSGEYHCEGEPARDNATEQMCLLSLISP